MPLFSYGGINVMLCSNTMTVSVTLSIFAVLISKVLINYCSMQHNHFGYLSFCVLFLMFPSGLTLFCNFCFDASFKNAAKIAILCLLFQFQLSFIGETRKAFFTTTQISIKITNEIIIRHNNVH